MKISYWVVILSCILACRAAAQDVALTLYLDPATGQVSNVDAPGRVALGSFVPSATAVDLEGRLAVMEQRLARIEGASPAVAPVASSEVLQSATVQAATPGAAPPVQTAQSASKSDGSAADVDARYADRAFRFTTADQRFSLALQNRVQLRYADGFDEDPRSLAELDRNQPGFQVRRSRFRVAGHLYQPWMTYNMQYDWGQPVMRDFFVNLAPTEMAELRVGRGKVIYNDERVTSSGRQQFVNRSIVNDLFTVDRQEGMQLHGRLFRTTPADLNYVMGVFTGRGVGSRTNDDDRLMLAGRLQWNALGGAIPFSQSDLGFSETLMLNLAVGGARNRSNCTVFATDNNSCRALPGFTAPALAAPGQFDLVQYLAEVRLRWMGFSMMGEWHRKDVTDRALALADPRRSTDLRGGFVQAGLLPHGLFPALPPQLEVALRYGRVDPDDPRGSDRQEEYTAAINWFIDGHANKLTLELGHLTVADPFLQRQGSENRLRVQWDLSF